MRSSYDVAASPSCQECRPVEADCRADRPRISRPVRSYSIDESLCTSTSLLPESLHLSLKSSAASFEKNRFTNSDRRVYVDEAKVTRPSNKVIAPQLAMMSASTDPLRSYPTSVLMSPQASQFGNQDNGEMNSARSLHFSANTKRPPSKRRSYGSDGVAGIQRRRSTGNTKCLRRSVSSRSESRGEALPLQKSYFTPSGTDPLPEDSKHPTPCLYDLVLGLNSAPGLDAWWANTVGILCSHYGARRATLSLPGDSSDLENIPWLQQATYNPSDIRDWPLRSGLSRTEALVTERMEPDAFIKPKSTAKRPSLSSRHSYSGAGKSILDNGIMSDAEIQISGTPSRSVRPSDSIPLDRTHDRTHDRPTTAPNENRLFTGDPHYAKSEPIPKVFSVPRAMDSEHDPLIKLTDIPKLLGRTEPVVLTRVYGKSLFTDNLPFQSPYNDIPATPGFVPGAVSLDSSVFGSSAPGTPTQSRVNASFSPGLPVSRDAYVDYEESRPSVWSQSEGPSPPPLGQSETEHNPFFARPALGLAFPSTAPPNEDYSDRRDIEAVGTDQRRTIIQIPLRHSPLSAQSPDNLRFPLAIISILTPISPYPPNLRQSLALLLPHLTTSFSSAQQYSRLESRLSGSSQGQHYSHLLGLGGTFSDADSELELVAGLSKHVNLNEEFTPTQSVAWPSYQSDPILSLVSSPADSNDPLHSPGLILKGPHDGDGYFGSHAKQTGAQRLHRIPERSRASSVSASSHTEKMLDGIGMVDIDRNEASRSSPSMAMFAPISSRFPSSTSMAHLEHTRPFSDTIAQLMLNSVPLHLFLAKSQTGEVVWTNAKFDAYRQLPGQKSRDPWTGVHDSEREFLSKAWSKALCTGSQFTEMVRVRRSDDEESYRWFIFRANPLLSSTGELIYWIGSFLDVHEQHIAELKANQEREAFATNAKYRALANSIPQIVFEAADDHGLLFVNDQWTLYTGQSTQEALRFGFAQHIHHDDLENCDLLNASILNAGQLPVPDHPTSTKSHRSESFPGSTDNIGVRPPAIRSTTMPVEDDSPFSKGITGTLQELVRRKIVSRQRDENGREFYTLEARLRSHGGDYRWHLVRVVRMEPGTTENPPCEAYWYGTCTDINDRKILEKKLNTEMETKTKFFSNMSHEIRTPLNGILGTIPFILDTPLDNEQRRMLDTIQNSSSNLRELVDNILDVSKVEAGKMSLIPQWFHVRSLLEDVIDTIGSKAVDKGLELNYMVDIDVPPTILGDRFRIRQVLINLIGNAIKFTDEGEVFARCSTLHDHGSSMKGTEILVNFEVIDTGKGFSPMDSGHLMQQFAQIHANELHQHGSGLGLFLSKQLVEMHGGRLTPWSDGHGAKFSFFIKANAPPNYPPAAASIVQQHKVASASPTIETGGGSGRLEIKTPLQNLVSTVDLDTLSTPAGATPVSPPSQGSNFSSQESPTLANASSLSTCVDNSLETRPVNNVLIVCPLRYTREAVKQHIEKITPYDTHSTIAFVSGVEEWRSLEGLKFTHLVLCLQDTSDVIEVMQSISETKMNGTALTLVIIADMYQKRDISDQLKVMETAGYKVFVVLKPVKPCAFSVIFDPDHKRELSKDRNQDLARAVNKNFRTIYKLVKQVVGNKGHRVLLVEDDPTNLQVMLKYLDKVKLLCETASNGQECLEKVFSESPGYYSLIIVSWAN